MGLLLGALLGSVYELNLGNNEWEPMNGLNLDYGMGECLAQHLGICKESYLVYKIE